MLQGPRFLNGKLRQPIWSACKLQAQRTSLVPRTAPGYHCSLVAYLLLNLVERLEGAAVPWLLLRDGCTLLACCCCSCPAGLRPVCHISLILALEQLRGVKAGTGQHPLRVLSLQQQQKHHDYSLVSMPPGTERPALRSQLARAPLATQCICYVLSAADACAAHEAS